MDGGERVKKAGGCIFLGGWGVGGAVTETLGVGGGASVTETLGVCVCVCVWGGGGVRD